MSSASLQPFELTHLDYRVTELELTRPFATARRTITRREIIVVRVAIRIAGASVVGFGEVAPLPGWSRESVADCRGALEGLSVPIGVDSVTQLDQLRPEIGRFSTLRFGVELALLDALARHQKTPLSALLREHFNPEERAESPRAIPLQSTVGSRALDELLAHAEQAQEDGFAYLKVKVGVDALSEDFAKIAALLARHPNLKLRLDANGAWSIPQALGAIDALERELPAGGVELIEQPVCAADFDDFLAQFSARAERPGAAGGLAIAADESADSFERSARLIESGAMGAIVLKPSTLGGLLPCAKLIALAQARGVRVILSNLLLSAIGRRAVAHLAAAFPQLRGPHGLATGTWFRRDIAPDADRIEDAKLVLSRAPGLGFTPTVALPALGDTP